MVDGDDPFVTAKPLTPCLFRIRVCGVTGHVLYIASLSVSISNYIYLLAPPGEYRPAIVSSSGLSCHPIATLLLNIRQHLRHTPRIIKVMISSLTPIPQINLIIQRFLSKYSMMVTRCVVKQGQEITERSHGPIKYHSHAHRHLEDWASYATARVHVRGWFFRGLDHGRTPGQSSCWLAGNYSRADDIVLCQAGGSYEGFT